MRVRARALPAIIAASLAAVPAAVPALQAQQTTPVRRPLAAAPSGDARGSEMMIVATDHHFDSPDQIDAGLVNIRMLNRGKELHHVLLMKVDRLTRLSEIRDLLRNNDWSPPWIHALGGPESPLPGGTASVSMVLEPGRYIIACTVASPSSHRLHYMDGMIEEVSVVSGGRSWVRPALPKADVTLKLNEWNYELSTPIYAGRRTIRVENVGKREHQVAFVRLLPNKTVAEAVKWAQNPSGPPPFEVAGGTTGMSPNQVVNVEADFIPGEYLLLCSLFDALGRKSHLAMGMVKRITVTN